jgi:hypothetical protein
MHSSEIASIIIEEWKSYGNDPGLLPSNPTPEWLNGNSSMTKPLTGSRLRPIVTFNLPDDPIKLTLYTCLNVETNRRSFSASEVINLMIKDGANTVALVNISQNGDPDITTCHDGDRRCYTLIYGYDQFSVVESGHLTIVAIGYRKEPYIKYISPTSAAMVVAHCIDLDDVVKYRTRFNNVLDYLTERHAGLAMLMHKMIDEGDIEPWDRVLIPLVYQRCGKSAMIASARQMSIYRIYCGLMNVVELHREILSDPYISMGDMIPMIHAATAPYEPSLYLKMANHDRWDILEKMLKVHRPKSVINLLDPLMKDKQVRIQVKSSLLPDRFKLIPVVPNVPIVPNVQME